MPRKYCSPFHAGLSLELTKLGLTQADLARRLKVSPTTLSDWTRSLHPAPSDLRSRIEKTLRLPNGTLPEPPAVERRAWSQSADSDTEKAVVHPPEKAAR